MFGMISFVLVLKLSGTLIFLSSDGNVDLALETGCRYAKKIIWEDKTVDYNGRETILTLLLLPSLPPLQIFIYPVSFLQVSTKDAV